jgi:hypothetical protein
MNAPVEIVARDLLAAHKRTFHNYWDFIDRYVETAMFHGQARTVFGWPARALSGSNQRTIANYLAQANGAEMMRIAMCLGIERGVEVCAAIHDAFLITAPVDEIDAAVATMTECMDEASRAVLDGFVLGVEAKTVRYPDRFMDKREGSWEMWESIWSLIAELEEKAA